MLTFSEFDFKWLCMEGDFSQIWLHLKSVINIKNGSEIAHTNHVTTEVMPTWLLNYIYGYNINKYCSM